MHLEKEKIQTHPTRRAMRRAGNCGVNVSRATVTVARRRNHVE
jgi:hypothetical protein